MDYRLKRGLYLVFISTVLCLFYVYCQVGITILGYDISNKEDELSQLIYNNEFLTYKVSLLKSIDRLHNRLIEREDILDFSSYPRIVKITPADLPSFSPPLYKSSGWTWLNLLSFISENFASLEAQAKE